MPPRNGLLVVFLACTAIVAGTRAASAQDPAPETRPRIDLRRINFDGLPVAPRAPKADERPAEATPRKGPSFVMATLYTATALGQALDAHSTLSALHSGAKERNPIMGALAKHPPAFIALKAGAAVGLIYAGHSVAKKNKKQAIIVLAAIDAAYFAIAAHNYHVAGRQR